MKQPARHIVTIADPKSPGAEAYRTLRTNIQFCSLDKPIRTIAVTSATPGEGKSTTAINLATAFANAGQKVILIDADLRRPMVHKVFHLDNNKGLTTILVSSNSSFESAIAETQVDGLYIIPSGPIPPNPAELLGTQRFRDLLSTLCEYTDVIIIDTPPVMAVTDAAVVGSRVDGVVLVVNSGSTPRPTVVQAKAAMESVKANILGVVLNQVDRTSGDYYYYYHYGEKRKKGSERTAD